MNGDGNLSALARYEKENDEAERKYDRFISTVLAAGILEDYEEAKHMYDKLADKWGYDTPFEEFIGENV